MIESQVAIVASAIHLLYYLYFQVIADLIRLGESTKNNHLEFVRLRSAYNIPVKTFQRNGALYGYAWFRSIYLNENLLTTKAKGKSDAYYALKWTFHHEYYHLIHNHKMKLLAARFVLSLQPLLLIILPWWGFLPIYVGTAVAMHYQKEHYETKANEHADKVMNHE